MTESKIRSFVPAMALEFTSSNEPLTLTQKLKFALIRFYYSKDYFTTIPVHDPMPGVFLEEYKLNPIELGYDVVATIRCG